LCLVVPGQANDPEVWCREAVGQENDPEVRCRGAVDKADDPEGWCLEAVDQANDPEVWCRELCAATGSSNWLLEVLEDVSPVLSKEFGSGQWVSRGCERTNN
jgi:hypothetical protein